MTDLSVDIPWISLPIPILSQGKFLPMRNCGSSRSRKCRYVVQAYPSRNQIGKNAINPILTDCPDDSVRFSCVFPEFPFKTRDGSEWIRG